MTVQARRERTRKIKAWKKRGYQYRWSGGAWWRRPCWYRQTVRLKAFKLPLLSAMPGLFRWAPSDLVL